MMAQVPDAHDNRFLLTHIPELLERFSLSYESTDATCLGYFLYSKESSTTISRDLIVSHAVFSKSLYVSKFYPEIYRELNCRYLSAACFYLIAHHAIQTFHLADNCWVNLEAEETVYESFYSRLNDFDFKIQYHRPANRSHVRGRYHQIPLNTEMITVHAGSI